MKEMETIQVGTAGRRERKKRQRELWFALAGIVLIILLTWVELRYIGAESYLFVALFQFNFVLLAVTLFVVLRNIIKLVLERRRKVLGSKLRSRLVLAFMSLSLVPTMLMFLLSIQFVQTSVDYWFKTQFETSMNQALEVGQEFYSLAQKRVERLSGSLLEDIISRGFAWGGKTMDKFLEEKKEQHGLSLLGILTPDGKKQNWHMDSGWEPAWEKVNERIDWEAFKDDGRFLVMPYTDEHMDIVVGVLPVDEGNTGFLILIEDVGPGLIWKMNQIVRGVDEYRKLKKQKDPLKLALYLTLGLMTMSIILGSIWFGFRLAKELSAPVQALALGTQRIAKGDLAVRLEDKSSDELGFLVQSFNSMAADLQKGQDRITRANEQLNEQNQKLEERRNYIEAVLNNITAGVISLDGTGVISTVNKAAETMLGLDGREIVGLDPSELMRGEYADIFQEALSALSDGAGSVWQRQMRLNLGSREATFLVNIVSLAPTAGYGSESGLVAVFEDITELEKMQRLAAWREVARRIAHEIKNPLTPIKLSAQRLERKFGSAVEDPVFLECTMLIVQQVEQMQQMVREFSAFAKMPEVVPKPGDLAPFLQELVTLFTNSHSRISWVATIPEELPRIEFDAEAMQRVFMNIFNNAAEVLTEQAAPRVEIEALYDDILKLVRIEIRDNGPGLTAEERSRLFEPYFSRKKGGTGLGLTIARSIVTDHHGYIRVRPNQPTGTIFVIELPNLA